MPSKVVLAVGLDSWLLTHNCTVWRTCGYIVLPAASIREAIDHFKAGDFDLALLGDSMSMRDKERLTFLIRASGSRTPVVCIADSSGDVDSFADATLKNDSSALRAGMGELLAIKSKMHAEPTVMPGKAR